MTNKQTEIADRIRECPDEHGIYPIQTAAQTAARYDFHNCNIALIDADLLDNGTRHPNLVLMKLSRYFKNRGCTVRLIENYRELYLDVGMMTALNRYDGLRQYDAVYVSKVFDYTKIDRRLLSFDHVYFGGTGFYFDHAPALPGEIEHTISVIKFPENGKDVYYFEDKINYTTTKQEQKTYEKRKKKLLASLKLKKGTSEYARYQNVSKIYKWITSNVSYDNTSKMNTAYDALINRHSTCQGYSALLYDLCRSSNIPCRILIGKTVQGKAKGLHEWNMVKCGKKWYQLDSTWDASNGFNQQFYFLRGSSFFSNDHTLWKRYQTKQFKKNFPLAKTDYKPKGKLK